MLWGATEIALAELALHRPSSEVRSVLQTAGSWARAYIAQGHSYADGDDTMNLYDDGAVAEADLIRAMRETGFASGVTSGRLLEDLADQIQLGEAYAQGDADPFSLGTQLGQSDATPHAFGLYITNALYEEYGGSDQFQAFADQEIANLSGSLNGEPPLQLGAATDGPTGLANLQGLSTVTGMRACSVPGFDRFNNSVAGYEDNVASWPTVEPADDYTAASLLAFSLAANS
jgi:hypothetical protein